MSAIVKLADNSSVYEVAKVSPLSIATQLSKKFDNQVYLKREDDQIIHSFKLRGAYQKMSSMSDQQKAKGVIASSCWKSCARGCSWCEQIKYKGNNRYAY